MTSRASETPPPLSTFGDGGGGGEGSGGGFDAVSVVGGVALSEPGGSGDASVPEAVAVGVSHGGGSVGSAGSVDEGVVEPDSEIDDSPDLCCHW